MPGKKEAKICILEITKNNHTVKVVKMGESKMGLKFFVWPRTQLTDEIACFFLKNK